MLLNNFRLSPSWNARKKRYWAWSRWQNLSGKIPSSAHRVPQSATAVRLTKLTCCALQFTCKTVKPCKTGHWGVNFGPSPTVLGVLYLASSKSGHVNVPGFSASQVQSSSFCVRKRHDEIWVWICHGYFNLPNLNPLISLWSLWIMVPPHLHCLCLWGQGEPGPGSLDSQAEAPLFPRVPRCATVCHECHCRDASCTWNLCDLCG